MNKPPPPKPDKDILSNLTSNLASIATDKLLDEISTNEKVPEDIRKVAEVVGEVKDIYTTISSASTLGMAIDVVKQIINGDPEFAAKYSLAVDTAKLSGQNQTFTHPVSLPGVFKVLNNVSDLLDHTLEGTYEVTPDGRLISGYDRLNIE